MLRKSIQALTGTQTAMYKSPTAHFDHWRRLGDSNGIASKGEWRTDENRQRGKNAVPLVSISGNATANKYKYKYWCHGLLTSTKILWSGLFSACSLPCACVHTSQRDECSVIIQQWHMHILTAVFVSDKRGELSEQNSAWRRFVGCWRCWCCCVLLSLSPARSFARRLTRRWIVNVRALRVEPVYLCTVNPLKPVEAESKSASLAHRERKPRGNGNGHMGTGMEEWEF